MVQLITAQQSASAQYTIDARGVAAGHYTLRIEGVLTINVTVTAVPEPASMALIGTGIAGLAAVRRKRKARAPR